MKTEKWKPIKGYEGIYEISNLGRVKSVKRYRNLKDRIMSATDNGHGYLIVPLSKNSTRKNHYVHRLVAEHFVPNEEPDKFIVVNHIDFDKRNNNANNLEWCTQKYNVCFSRERMCKARTVPTTSATGEKYIYFRKSTSRFRIAINGHETTRATIQEAIEYRDKILLGEERWQSRL